MAGLKKVTGTLFAGLIVVILLSHFASAAVDIDYKKGAQVKYQPEVSGINEIQFIAECDGVMTVSSSDANRIDILSSCKPRNLYVKFVVPNDKAVYQTKDTTGKKMAVRLLQKRVSVSTDGRYNIILTKPESIGRFEFMGDSVNQDDNFIVENAADQTIKANMKTIDAATIIQKDNEIYNYLQATNLSAIDYNFFKRVTNVMKLAGVRMDTINNLFNDLARILRG